MMVFMWFCIDVFFVSASRDCNAVLMQEIYNTKTVSLSQGSIRSLQMSLCKSSAYEAARQWHSTIGTDAAIQVAVEGIPLGFSHSSTQAEAEAMFQKYQKNYCGNLAEFSDESWKVEITFREVSPKVIEAWTTCMDTEETFWCSGERKDDSYIVEIRYNGHFGPRELQLKWNPPLASLPTVMKKGNKHVMFKVNPNTHFAYTLEAHGVSDGQAFEVGCHANLAPLCSPELCINGKCNGDVCVCSKGVKGPLCNIPVLASPAPLPQVCEAKAYAGKGCTKCPCGQKYALGIKDGWKQGSAGECMVPPDMLVSGTVICYAHGKTPLTNPYGNAGELDWSFDLSHVAPSYSGYGCNACPFTSRYALGVKDGYKYGSASECKLPTGYSLKSGTTLCYVHGTTPIPHNHGDAKELAWSFSIKYDPGKSYFGHGCKECPFGEQYSLGVTTGWEGGSVSECKVPPGWTLLSGNLICYAHGSAPEGNPYGDAGPMKWSFVLQR